MTSFDPDLQQSDGYLPYIPRFGSYWSIFTQDRSVEDAVEFPENPSRLPILANKLQSVVNNPVGGPALTLTCDFSLSSGEGDESGIAVVEDPLVFIRDRRRLGKQITLARHALSGFRLEHFWQIVWRFLAWGDCFASVVVDKDDRLKPLLLPTWQIFLEVDEWTGDLTRVYQQRPGMPLEQREIDLSTFVHWSYRKRFVYGRSLYFEVRHCSDYYFQNSDDIAQASRSAALTPSVHVMPEGADSSYLQEYKADHKQQLKQGPVSDIYLPFGADYRRSGSAQEWPLAAMTESLKLRRLEIGVASRVPLYLLGVEYRSAREISMQPAITFKLHVGRVRSILAEGLRTCIDRYLDSHGIKPPYAYKLLFPRIELNPFNAPSHDSDSELPGIVDIDN